MEVDPQQRLPAPRSLLAVQSLRKGRSLQGYFSPMGGHHCRHPFLENTAVYTWSAMERAHIK